jgi:hypothetical protein
MPLAALTLACTRRDVATTPDAAPEASAPMSANDADAPEAAPVEPAFVPPTDGGVFEVVRRDSPNMRYARLDRAACFAELGRRSIAYEEVTAIDRAASSQRWAAKPKVKAKPKPKPKPPAPLPPHLLAPIRLRGPLHGIAIHSGLPEKQRAKAPLEILDCRLVLALDDFAALLAQHGVSEVVHMSGFRSDNDRGCTTKYSGKQHCGALAIDVGLLKKSDGSTLEVERDFHGKIGTSTCTAGAGPNPVTPAATELWTIVCDAARRGLFHVTLTPNFNEEHRNHLHLEITPGVNWMLVH